MGARFDLANGDQVLVVDIGLSIMWWWPPFGVVTSLGLGQAGHRFGCLQWHRFVFPRLTGLAVIFGGRGSASP